MPTLSTDPRSPVLDPVAQMLADRSRQLRDVLDPPRSPGWTRPQPATALGQSACRRWSVRG